MVYQAKFVAETEDAAFVDWILKVCNGRDHEDCRETCPIKNFMGQAISYTVHFLDGKRMDIRVVGGCPPQTEAALLAENGEKLHCTETREEFFGQWILDYEGDIYQVRVIREGADLDD